MIGHAAECRFVEVHRAARVAGTSPHPQHLGAVGAGEVLEGREGRHPALVDLEDARHLRLLCGHPCHQRGVRVAGAAPGERLPVRVVPRQQARADGAEALGSERGNVGGSDGRFRPLGAAVAEVTEGDPSHILPGLNLTIFFRVVN